MKTDALILPILVAFCLMQCNCAKSEPSNQSDSMPTNVFSLTQNDIWDETGEEESYYANCVIHQIVMPERLPSNLDTNGNWGPETNGLQLSLRFRDKKYTIGEQVRALIVLRNLKTNSRILLLTNSSSLYVRVLVRSDINTYLPQRIEPVINQTDYHMPISSVPHGLSNFDFAGRSEKVILLNLSRIFGLNKPGNYTANAFCRVYSPDTKSVLYEVESGSASFSLVNATNSP